MLRNKLIRLLPIGLLLLAAGLLLHNFFHGRHTEFSSGLLIGMSLVFIIAGSVARARAISG